jgi:hypothetical protein
MKNKDYTVFVNINKHKKFIMFTQNINSNKRNLNKRDFTSSSYEPENFFCCRNKKQKVEQVTNNLSPITTNITTSFFASQIQNNNITKSQRTLDMCVIRKEGTNMYKIFTSYDMKRQLQTLEDIHIVEIIPLFNPQPVFQKFLSKVQKNIMFYSGDWMRIHSISDDMMKHYIFESVMECNK